LDVGLEVEPGKVNGSMATEVVIEELNGEVLFVFTIDGPEISKVFKRGE
jgi:hypothetical protein